MLSRRSRSGFGRTASLRSCSCVPSQASPEDARLRGTEGAREPRARTGQDRGEPSRCSPVYVVGKTASASERTRDRKDVLRVGGAGERGVGKRWAPSAEASSGMARTSVLYRKGREQGQRADDIGLMPSTTRKNKTRKTPDDV